MTTNLNKLFTNNYYDQVLKSTEFYVGRFQDINNSSIMAYFHRIRALITLGEFDETEKLCYEVLSKTKERNVKRFVYDFLSQIYFYKKEYIKAIYYCKLEFDTTDRDRTDMYQKNLRSIVLNILKDEGIDIKVKSMDILNHIRTNHLSEYGDDQKTYETVIKCVKENFYKSKCYYENKIYYRIFRCQNVAIDKNEKGGMLDYVKVVCFSDSPDNILTIHPIKSSGSLEYYDISADFIKDKKPNTMVRSNKTNKFYERQSKKKN